jgi:hypothetical protein
MMDNDDDDDDERRERELGFPMQCHSEAQMQSVPCMAYD